MVAAWSKSAAPVSPEAYSTVLIGPPPSPVSKSCQSPAFGPRSSMTQEPFRRGASPRMLASRHWSPTRRPFGKSCGTQVAAEPRSPATIASRSWRGGLGAAGATSLRSIIVRPPRQRVRRPAALRPVAHPAEVEVRGARHARRQLAGLGGADDRDRLVGERLRLGRLERHDLVVERLAVLVERGEERDAELHVGHVELDLGEVDRLREPQRRASRGRTRTSCSAPCAPRAPASGRRSPGPATITPSMCPRSRPPAASKPNWPPSARWSRRSNPASRSQRIDSASKAWPASKTRRIGPSKSAPGSFGVWVTS